MPPPINPICSLFPSWDRGLTVEFRHRASIKAIFNWKSGRALRRNIENVLHETGSGLLVQEWHGSKPMDCFYLRINLATVSYSHAISAWALAP